MTAIQLTSIPVMKTGMLVRRPAAEVFEALVDPAVTTKFWFTRSTGRLETGKQVQWFWDMYDVSAEVTVKAVEPGTRRRDPETGGSRGSSGSEWAPGRSSGPRPHRGGHSSISRSAVRPDQAFAAPDGAARQSDRGPG